jgi:arylsulfatase A-like enzyme
MPLRAPRRARRAGLGVAAAGLAPGLVAAAGLALLVAAGGCGGAERAGDGALLRPVQRFAGRRLDQRVDTRGLPSAVIGDETRYVLRAPPEVFVPGSAGAVASDGSLSLEAALPESIARAKKLLGTLTLVAGDASVTLPRRIYATREGPERNVLALRVPAPPELAGAAHVEFVFRGLALGTIGFSRYETQALEVPAGAVLEFGIGLLEPELSRDAVAFSVEACAGEECHGLFERELDPERQGDGGWHDHSVPLDGLAGRSLRFVFGARRLRAASEFSAPVWSNPTLYAPSPRRPQDVNVILLSVDTLRADHLSSYGYARDTAPFVEERLARAGTLFEAVSAATPVTAPSHMTMFTGLQPSAHGLIDGLRVLSGEIRTLPELLRAAHVDTAAFTENGYVGQHQGFGRGFDVFAENKSAEIGVPEGQVDLTFAQARAWLSRNARKRFFLFLHTYQVHAPYAAPERYRPLFTEHAGLPIGPDTPEHLRLMAEYDREIRYVDDELRRLFESIDALGLAERSVFILTSDHGEEFMEHGLLYHGGHLYEEALRVPLVLAGPGIPAGRRVETPVGQLHLMPTILDLFGLEPVPGREARSLLPLVRGEGSGDFAAQPVFGEAWVRFQPGLGGGRRFHPPSFSVRAGSRKLTRSDTPDGTRYELYDLAADPLERRDLYPQAPEAAADLAEALRRYRAEREAERRRVGGAEIGAAPGPPAPVDAEREEKLRALGYLE